MNQNIWFAIYLPIMLFNIYSCSDCSDKIDVHEDKQSNQFDKRIESATDSLFMQEAKLAMYIANFRKGMFRCQLYPRHDVYLSENDIDVLDVNIYKTSTDKDTIHYYLYLYLLGDTCNKCGLKDYKSICELVRIRGSSDFYPVECGLMFTPMVIPYVDSINSISNVKGLEFRDYPFTHRKDSFEKFLITYTWDRKQLDVRSDFLKEYCKMITK